MPKKTTKEFKYTGVVREVGYDSGRACRYLVLETEAGSLVKIWEDEMTFMELLETVYN